MDAVSPSDGLRRTPSAATLLVYAGDGRLFRAWCRGHDLPSLPAAPATVAAYLDACAGQFSPGTLTRRLAGIAELHRQHGHASPVDAGIRRQLRDLRQTDRRRRLPLPPTQDRLLHMAAGCPGDLPGTRDRALLLLSAAGLGRSALIGLDVEDVRFTDPGVDLTIRNPGRGPAGGGRTVNLERETAIARCPARALERWLSSSDAAFGPVFRKIDRWGNIEHRRLHTDAIRRIWLRRSKKAGPA
jgi:integrase